MLLGMLLGIRSTVSCNRNDAITKKFLSHEKIVALAEMMNYPGVIFCDPDVLAKISTAARQHKPVDGHAPGLTGQALYAYIAAGIQSDHECTTALEAMLASLAPRDARLLVIENGVYGERMRRIADIHGVDAKSLRREWTAPLELDEVERLESGVRQAGVDLLLDAGLGGSPGEIGHQHAADLGGDHEVLGLVLL